MNWFAHSRSSHCVGFIKEGGACEGGSCEHLKEGDKAFGESSENDSFGSEVYLYCEPCYEKFLEERKAELVDCNDCKGEFPRSETRFYTPYDPDSLPHERVRFQLCKDCLKGDRHKQRLERDQANADADRAYLDED